ncbi:MAG: GNAT family N-acetyltransferase [Bacteroidota bacterium]
MIKILPASDVDIPIIQKLAEEIWWKYYPPIIGYKQVQYMLDKFYSSESITHQMNKLKHQFYLILNNNKKIGFISIEKQTRKKLFIHKFYILQNNAGKGIGTKVFKYIIKTFHPSEIRLTVNRQNYKAINFYFKNGFKIEKVEDFDIGNGFYMNDFVMVWKRDIQ